MNTQINVALSPKTVAKLILSGELDLQVNWSFQEAQSVVDALRALSVQEILKIVDAGTEQNITSDIVPQFNTMSTLVNVPKAIVNTGYMYLNYTQLGFQLKLDPNATVSSNNRFGITYGWGAYLLGLINCNDGKLSASPLGVVLASLNDPVIQTDIVNRLFFRLSVVQEILRRSAHGEYNAYESISMLAPSTMKRRKISLDAIFRSLRTLNDIELNQRLNHIKWLDE